MDDDTSGAPTNSPVRLLLVSDTHLPLRARKLPDELLLAIERVDVVMHAGDWVDLATLEQVEGRARRLVGVYGNNDGAELRAQLPQVARVRLAGLRFGVVHETGAARGREARCAACYPDLDVLVFGHSHIPWDTETPGGLRLLNPGSPTDRRRQPYCTYMTCTAQGGVLGEVALHRLHRQ
ncbi:metallophosphoesterase family protein [Streptomyces anulatus]|uniref:metallophosphoesterase family protein n=1 Tax=Streptomyces anulatus TaxID=1892 RepID=UPI00363BBEB5